MSSFAVLETVPEFFSNKSVFITGGTGFIGKVLIEKLLRSCPDVGKIYVLMRTKKGSSVDRRLNDTINLPLFDKLRKIRPGIIEEKLIPVEGDVTLLDLGLSTEDRHMLLDNVSVVYHTAASVRFDDPLKDAIILNTRGTREVVKLTSSMKKLSVFIHVSTTYSNCDREIVKEQLYPPHADWRTAIDVAEKLDRYTIQTVLHKYMDKHPNTYTFTKSMAEHVVYDLCNDRIPTVIFRPSIVISTLEEPIPGWIDNFNGPVGTLVASGKGILRTSYSDPDVIPDYNPADVAVKGLILATWKKGITRNFTQKLKMSFYNCSSYSKASVTVRETVELAKRVLWESPLNDAIWFPGGGVTKWKYWYYVRFFFLHIIPALIIDLILKSMDRKPMLFKLQRKIFTANMALNYFILRQWTFINDNFLALEKEIHPQDKEEFSYHMDNIDPFEYFKNAALGARQYLLHEDNSTLEKAKIHIRRLYVLDIFVKAIFFLFCAWFFVFKFDICSLIL